MTAWGWVPVEDRGSLPFALVHGESLVATASWALGDAGVELLDQGTPFEQVRRSGRALVLHDPLCPLTPPDFIADAVAEAEEDGVVVVGWRPVTDTVKPLSGDLDGGVLGATVHRSALVEVTSPVVLPAALLAGLDEVPTADFAELVATLVERLADGGDGAGDAGGNGDGAVRVQLREAPALGRRIRDEAGLAVLEALSRSVADE